MLKDKHKNRTKPVVKTPAQQRRLEQNRMIIAKLCLEREPIQAIFDLLGICDLLIQTIPQDVIREWLMSEVTRAFANSLKPHRRRRSNDR